MTWQALKDRCKNGHPFDGENTRIDSRTGRRACIECGRIRSREFQRRKRTSRGSAGDATTSPSPSTGQLGVQP